jgi:DNA-directed RNA polymerase subunit beta'
MHPDPLDGLRIDDCSSVRLGLASPEDILRQSCGEVTNPDTINYRTARPVGGGLFCERIFGPERDWECGCGKYRGIKYKGMRCDRCGVVVAHSRTRRKRLGHIELAVPVVHLWFFRLRPSILAHLLGLKAREVERLVYLKDHVVLDPGPTGLEAGQLLTDDELHAARADHGNAFDAGTGAEAIARMLAGLDLAALASQLRDELADVSRRAHVSAEAQRRLVQRLKVVRDLLHSGNEPQWMVLRRLPVIPPDLRPVVLLETGNYASSDLNDLYRRVLQRNARLRKLLDLHAPEIIIRNEKRLLQQAVDALFDNARCERPVLGTGQRPLKSLADMLKGKQGIFRQNLLGKRVDYSARSVIVVGPRLALHQCGLPKVIALELFQPFIVGRLIKSGAAATIQKARRLIKERAPVVWEALAEVIQGHHVLLNRAPTLHRMGIQAFEPVLVEGNAIQLHPLVCKAFNADFDGDQMAVHLPLSVQARREARERMTPASNVFSPANGLPIITPSKDMVLGCYYLTASRGGAPGKAFASPGEVILAHAQGKLGVHDGVRVRLPGDREVVGEGTGPLVATTVGRVLFNDVLPEGMPFYDLPLTGKNLNRIIADCQERLGRPATLALLERVKEVGFREATRSGLSFAAADLRTPADKARILAETDAVVGKVRALFEDGYLGAEERAEGVIALWKKATEKVRDALAEELAAEGPDLNPIHAMLASGARGSAEQLGQLAGMRGLMTRPSGEVLETPIRSSFKEGLGVLEYFSSTHGARKGLVDTALNTASSGYLTRKLADVAQNVVVSAQDCGTTRGVRKAARYGQDLADVLRGRVCLEEVRHPVTDDLLVGDGGLISAGQARALEGLGLEGVLVRSPLTCEAGRGVCRLCYGADLSTGGLVEEGLAVGIIAAQSIGEPATQLVMRIFHHGGTASAPDITTGLPRVIELFEAHKLDRAALLAEVSGVVRLGRPGERLRGRPVVFVKPDGGPERAHRVPAGRLAAVKAGQEVQAGQALTDGPVSPHDLLRTAGLEATQAWLLEEIQKVYREQGIDVDDRHVELILARMLARVKVRDPGDSDLLPGAVVERSTLKAVNGRLGRGKRARAASCVPLLLGVSRAALQAEGFLSAASFQETTRVLAEAALAGKEDELSGLKENVLLGKLIPAGSGYRAG